MPRGNPPLRHAVRAVIRERERRRQRRRRTRSPQDAAAAASQLPAIFEERIVNAHSEIRRLARGGTVTDVLLTAHRGGDRLEIEFDHRRRLIIEAAASTDWTRRDILRHVRPRLSMYLREPRS